MTTNHTGTSKMNILLTGGRAPATLDLARIFATAGHHVYVAESVHHHLCRVSNSVIKSFQVAKPNEQPEAYIRDLQNIVHQYEIDMLIPTCEEIFHISKHITSFITGCKIFSEPIERLDILHHKWKFIKLVQEMGFDVPETRLIHTSQEMKALGETGFFNKQTILKPVYSRFASRIQMIHPSRSQRSNDKVITEVGRSLSPSHPWIAQRFIHGQVLCSYSVIHDGKVMAHCAYKSDFTAGRGASIYFEFVDHPELLHWVEQFVQRYQSNGQIAFDFIQTADGTLYPLECNPRATSGIHLFRPQDNLDLAFVGPHLLSTNSLPLTPSSNSTAMLKLAMLSFGVVSNLGPHKLRMWYQAYKRSRDVVYSAIDPHPFREQFRILQETRRVSRKYSISMLEASTHDIEWNGD
ncbi:putative ATP-grasp superfamily ATP-dependent carboligase [Paenibacillus sp. DS2015]|uniref:ATP-grasp domain-containing protein n=1 Tax=Paenibacillus sp. DS2015 TaxID=3373917 RepID=UPI003D2224CC